MNNTKEIKKIVKNKGNNFIYNGRLNSVSIIEILFGCVNKLLNGVPNPK